MKSGKKMEFTLIELLVVVAIIMLLAAMLFPSLQKTRDKAREIQCAGNLKQIGVAIMSYTSDNKEWFPHSTPYSKLIQNNYILPQLFVCPANKTNPLWPYSYRKGYGCGYIWSYRMSGAIYASGEYVADCYPVSLNMLKKISKDPVLSDSKWPFEYNPYYGNPDYLCAAFVSISYMALPHNGGNNLVFADGHVSWASVAVYSNEIRNKGDVHPVTGRILTE